MDDDRFGPIALPAAAWRHDDVRAALTARDVPALLRAAKKYTGLTQARIGIAVGLGQGRTNEFFKGRRKVTELHVFERIADGLTMPDDARALLGLAPHRAVQAVTLAGHAEIAQVYPSQANAERELREHGASAKAVDVLAVRVLGLMALNDSLLWGPLTGRTTPVQVRVLLLDPDCPAAAVRAQEIAESTGSFAAGIRLSLARLAELDEHPFVHLEVRLYDDLPTWRIVGFDDVLYLSAFGASHEGHRSGVYKLTAAGDGVLHAGFRRQYDDMWSRARRPGGDDR